MIEKVEQIETGEPVDLSIDTAVVTKILTGFISDCIHKTASEKAIIGLSGGLDSSVAAALAVNALGADKVLGVVLPYKTSARTSREDAEKFARHIKITTELIDITPMVDAYFEQSRVLGADDNRRGNMMARQRMSVLYDISAREQGLVIGTSNKSELLLGYGTIFGDLACAVNPLGDLYKTQIRQLAESLKIPGYIRSKTPTADLVAGQTDESDLGFSYAEVDRFLYLWVDRRQSESELKESGFNSGFIKNVITRVRRNQFKKMSPVIAKISARTIGHEFRYAWEWSTIH
ncbi:NAD synthetase [bacterium SM23_31]|nr:MAG: NAD synthetase [bacterium SM23_31]